MNNRIPKRIIVKPVFDGTQSEKQAFLNVLKDRITAQSAIDGAVFNSYNQSSEILSLSDGTDCGTA